MQIEPAPPGALSRRWGEIHAITRMQAKHPTWTLAEIKGELKRQWRARRRKNGHKPSGKAGSAAS